MALEIDPQRLRSHGGWVQIIKGYLQKFRPTRKPVRPGHRLFLTVLGAKIQTKMNRAEYKYRLDRVYLFLFPQNLGRRASHVPNWPVVDALMRGGLHRSLLWTSRNARTNKGKPFRAN